MKVTIWGSRGSHPRAMTADSFQERVRCIIQKIQPSDLASNERRELFLSTLPNWLWNLPGGNTPCIEVELENGTRLIFDAGTGIVPLSGKISDQNVEGDFHIFFTHFHYDHIQGLPFFTHLYKPTSTINFYYPAENFQDALFAHMQHPFFPIELSKLASKQYYHVLSEARLRFKNAEVYWKKVNHPGTAYSYKIQENGKTVIIATDFEILPVDFEKNDANSSYFSNADLLIIDSMYTLGEAIEKYDWGHSSYSLGVDFAQAWNVKHLLLFHHDPQNTDKKLYDNLSRARLYAEKQNISDLRIDMARDNCEIIL